MDDINWETVAQS